MTQTKPWEGIVGGGITGAMEICFTYPIKYVKTQLQLEDKLGAARRYSGVFDCVRQTVRERGFIGLYRGLNIFVYAPKAAVRFGAFETLKVCRTSLENYTQSTFVFEESLIR